MLQGAAEACPVTRYEPLGPTMTHAEIAEELGTTREAVKHLELSALRKVRKALGIEAGSRERIKGVFHGRRQRCTKA